MSDGASVDFAGQLDVLHADQAPRYTIIEDAVEKGKYRGMLNWREFCVNLERPCESASRARQMLAERVFELYNVASQHPPLPSRITSAVASHTLVQADVQPKSMELKASNSSESNNPRQQRSASKMTPEEIERETKLAEQFSISAIVTHVDAEKPSVAANLDDGSTLHLVGNYARPLVDKLGVKITIRAVRMGASTDHIARTAPFVLWCRPVLCEDGTRLICAVLPGFAVRAKLPSNPPKIAFDGPYIAPFVNKHGISFYITSDLAMPAIAIANAPKPIDAPLHAIKRRRRGKRAGKSRQPLIRDAPQSKPAAPEPPRPIATQPPPQAAGIQHSDTESSIQWY